MKVRKVEGPSGMAQPSSKEAQVYLADTSSNEVKVDGSLEFVHEYGGNESKPSYQEASGAPVEKSPLSVSRSRGSQPSS
jgi:hypothetical protein